jgi:hypothetical protein
MRNHIIFSVLGGLIFFVWQSISWSGANFHSAEQTYTPLETAVLGAIAETGLEPGMYVLGMSDPALEQEDRWAQWEANFKGKPWGVLNYQASNDMTIGMNMFRGYCISVIAAALLFLLLSRTTGLTISRAVTTAVAIGFIGFLVEPYSYSIWYKTPGVIIHLLDGVLPWAILGLLAGRMLGAKKSLG